MAALEDDSDPTYTHFAHHDEFFVLHNKFTENESEERAELAWVESMGAILDFYLPLPGLLDPYLDDIVGPLMRLLAKRMGNLGRCYKLGTLINWVVKVRGWKAVDIQHLSSLVDILSDFGNLLLASQDAWELRAVLLLWLALLLTVPFSLSALSDESIPQHNFAIKKRLFPEPAPSLTERVALLAIPLLHRPGKEGSYAALVLARLYSRPDTNLHLPNFFHWAEVELKEGDRDGEANLVAGLLEMVALLPGMIAVEYLDGVRNFGVQLEEHLRGGRTLVTSGLVRKLVVKAGGRWCVKRLAGEKNFDGLEDELDSLMSGLSDKDTIVRYSSAKYLARVAALLPPALSAQIVLATIALFSGTDDEPVIETSFGTIADPGGNPSGGMGGAETVKGEARWHGVCLALAEMARRGLVVDEAGEAVAWVLKALTFDLRRASHSIGANVRDAAAYLVWSLSRACPAQILAPYAEDLATGLICVACLDREVGVRRAASAAFQEGVGRLGLYPEGIDVLGKTDFYSVSVRRVAFATAAPSVAVHPVYRRKLRGYLHDITLRHWDEAMRVLSASTLRALIDLELESLDDSIKREIAQLSSLDVVYVHGALLALTQLAPISTPAQKQSVLDAVPTIRPEMKTISRYAHHIIPSTCDLLTTCISLDNVTQPTIHSRLEEWLEDAMKSREEVSHEAAALLFGRISELREYTPEVKKLLIQLKSGRANLKRSAALALGKIQYMNMKDMVSGVVEGLLALLEPGQADVEARRYCMHSLADITCQLDGDTPLVALDAYSTIVKAFIKALDDYTTDQRGDVGSWIRIAALHSLGRTIPLSISSTYLKLGEVSLQVAIGGVVRLAAEKLEPVRGEAARCLAELRKGGVEWEGKDTLVFELSGDLPEDAFRFIDTRDWFSSGMPLLQTRYRTNLLAGLVQSIGCSIESISKSAFSAFNEYIIRLEPEVRFQLWDAMFRDMLELLIRNLNQNRVFIPLVITLGKVFGEYERFGWVEDSLSEGSRDACAKIVTVGCRGVAQLKSIERISAALRLAIGSIVLPFNIVRAKGIDVIFVFLAHRFPRIRAMAAEQLYIALSGMDEEVGEELEELLVGTSWTDEGVGEEEGKRVATLLVSPSSLGRV